MAPCDPNSNSINITPAPPISIPGLGIPVLSPFQIDLPDFDLPTELIEDIVNLIKSLGALFPSGLFKPNPDFGMKNIMDAISQLLSQLAPFLQLYNFFMALLNMILCIIEVLCAIPDPFATAAKLQKLFAECLPPFINLFPFLALIAMIIALLLLILALIEYLIETILAVIEAIIRNITILTDGLQLSDAQAVLAAINKIASLLCFIENLLAILLAIAAILAVIESLAMFGGTEVCGEESECCDPVICPPWLKNNTEIHVTQGKLTYNKQVGIDMAEVFAEVEGFPAEAAAIFNVPPTREERWQLQDLSTNPEVPIKNIIQPMLPLFPDFWPDEMEFSSTTSPKRSPYTADIEITLNPTQFGHLDTSGKRKFIIKNCVTVRRPYLGTINYSNILFFDNLNGTLNVEGGLVFEEDGETPFMIGEEQATLNTFIHQEDQKTINALTDDTLTFDIAFKWKPNHGALAGYNLTTIGCMPAVSLEKATQNAIILAEGTAAPAVKLPPVPPGVKVPSLGPLPNVAGTQECVVASINEFRADITRLNAANFQASALVCLQDLKDQTLSALCGALLVAVSIFKSTISLDTDLQFTTRPIQVSVVLKDSTGTSISTSIPNECAGDLADRLVGEVTLGQISKFNYDGTNQFIARITSDAPGDGELTVLFDNKVLSKIIPGNPTTIDENILAYTFIDGAIDTPVRRDASDVGT